MGIPLTTESEARWMTACPGCGAHKGAGDLLCGGCGVTRTDIVPFLQCNAGFADWLRYALSGRQVLTVEQLLEPTDL